MLVFYRDGSVVVQEETFKVSGSPRLVMMIEDGDITVRSSGSAGEI